MNDKLIVENVARVLIYLLMGFCGTNTKFQLGDEFYLLSEYSILPYHPTGKLVFVLAASGQIV
jgi:hypothetical protein